MGNDKPAVKKCDGKQEFCVAISERLQDGYKKGLNSALMINLKTGEELGPLILYKSSAADPGLVLNFCPWCGNPMNRRGAGRFG